MAFFRSIWIALVLALSAAPALAGWVTVKNETKQVIVIQEVGGPLNRPIRGKCVKLQPGETYREFQLLAGSKNIAIHESDEPGASSVQDKMTWSKEDASFAVKAEGKSIKLVVADAVDSVKIKK